VSFILVPIDATHMTSYRLWK